MVFTPLVQTVHARCDAQRRAANGAYDDLDTAVIALDGAATVWAVSCRQTATWPQIAGCGGAPLLLITAMRHEKSCRNALKEANRAYNDCMRRTNPSSGGEGG